MTARGLDVRRLDRALGGTTIHISIDNSPDDRDEFEDGEVPCCMSSAMRGPRACDCWEAVYDLEQTADLRHLPVQTRTECCGDCAYRNGSPERTDGYDEDLRELAGSRDRFACHIGMRRAVLYRHPDGREIPAGDGDYQPPILHEVAYKGDGTPADLCAGWAAHRRALLGDHAA